MNITGIFKKFAERYSDEIQLARNEFSPIVTRVARLIRSARRLTRDKKREEFPLTGVYRPNEVDNSPSITYQWRDVVNSACDGALRFFLSKCLGVDISNIDSCLKFLNSDQATQDGVRYLVNSNRYVKNSLMKLCDETRSVTEEQQSIVRDLLYSVFCYSSKRGLYDAEVIGRLSIYESQIKSVNWFEYIVRKLSEGSYSGDPFDIIVTMGLCVWHLSGRPLTSEQASYLNQQNPLYQAGDSRSWRKSSWHSHFGFSLAYFLNALANKLSEGYTLDSSQVVVVYLKSVCGIEGIS